MKIFGFGKLILGLMLLASLGWAQGLEGNFVGQAKNSKAFVAIIAAQGRVLAYICDGEKIAQWFRGSLGEGGVLAIEINSSTKFNAKISAGEVSGTAEVGGEKLEFSAVSATGNAGLFRAELFANAVTYTGGWIINQAGDQRGAVIGGGGFIASTSDLLGTTSEGSGGNLCSATKVNISRTATPQGVGRMTVWQVNTACVASTK